VSHTLNNLDGAVAIQKRGLRHKRTGAPSGRALLFGETMRLGLDIHGVIDKYPKEFACLAYLVRKNGGQVHIITGHSLTPSIFLLLKTFGIEYDYVESIQDNLLKRGAKIIGHDEDRPLFHDTLWNAYKAQYCVRNGIDLMIDNSPEYREYFITPFLLCK
jgi:hypothetical protein